MLIMGVMCFIGARREKEKILYLGGITMFLRALGFVSYLLKQAILFFILIVSAGLLSTVAIPKMHRLVVREQVKFLYEFDFSAPLRVIDIFTSKAWLVMASRWGIWKTLLLSWLFSVTIIGGVNFLLSLLGIVSMTDLIIYTIIGSIGSTVFLYWQLSKVF